MNTGLPSSNDKDQVKLNQQTSGDPQSTVSNPPPFNPPPAVPPAPAAVPLSSVSPPPAAKPAPAVPVAPPINQKNKDIGIGTDNIGVEKKLQPPTPEIKITPPEPQAPKPPTPPPLPPVNEVSTAKIEVQTTDIPIKSYDNSKTTDAPQANPPIAPQSTPQVSTAPPPPIKAGGGPAGTIVTLTVLALIIGAGGGFFGFRYWDKIKTSASTQTTPTPLVTASAGESASPTDTANWTGYTNDKYKFTIKYPDNWLASTTDAQAEDIIFAANQASLAASPSGARLEIVFQDSNGKTLKSWVEANSVTTGETKPVKELTVSGATAYQQEQTRIQPAVSTYIERPGKIMIVTLTAPPSEMGEAGSWYNSIINSIVLK